MYQFNMLPHLAADKHSHAPMADDNLIGSPFYPFGEPVEIRKASAAPAQRDAKRVPVKMYQASMLPHFAADKHSHGPMFGANLIGSPFYPFGEPVEIRKASAATHPLQRDSTVHDASEEFIIQLELRHYQPNEISVTSDDHQVTITAKHEISHSTDGCVSQAVTHVYNLPEGTDPKSLTAAVNSQGILIIRGTRSTTRKPPTL